MDTLLKSWIVVSRIVLLCIALYFFGWPFGVLCSAIRNPELKQGGIPPIAFKLHQNLSPKYGQWAQERVENADALKVGYLNVY